MDWQALKEWFFSLGARYHVNPIIFGVIYIGAIPFFTASIAWWVRNYRQGKSIILPTLCAGFCFISAYLYLIIAGRNVPLWVYVIVIAMVVLGAVSTVGKERRNSKLAWHKFGVRALVRRFNEEQNED